MKYVEDEFTSSFKADFKEIMKAYKGYNLKTILSGLISFVMVYIFIAGLIILL